jgi:hypothetical protein
VRRRREDAARSEGPSVAAYFAEATKAKKAMEGKLKVGRKTQDTRHKTMRHKTQDEEEEEEVMSLLVFRVQFSGRGRGL